jgi:hypothetical protein
MYSQLLGVKGQLSQIAKKQQSEQRQKECERENVAYITISNNYTFQFS